MWERHGRSDQHDAKDVLWAGHFIQHLSDGFKGRAVAPVECDEAWVIGRKLSEGFADSGAEPGEIGRFSPPCHHNRTRQSMGVVRQSTGKANGLPFSFTTTCAIDPDVFPLNVKRRVQRHEASARLHGVERQTRSLAK